MKYLFLVIYAFVVFLAIGYSFNHIHYLVAWALVLMHLITTSLIFTLIKNENRN